MIEPSVVFLSALGLFLRLAAPGITADDSGEFAVCSFLLGNSHAPGYPLHFLLGRLEMLLPLGSPAFRLTLLSASLGALGVLAARSLARETGLLCRLAPRGVRVAGLVSAACFGFLPLLLEQSTRGEKYSLFIALAGWSLALFVRWYRQGRRGMPGGAVLLAGLAAAAHYLAAALLVPLAVVAFRRRSIRAAVLMAVLAAIPLSSRLLYPPLRSAGAAQLDVASPGTARSLGRYLAVASYGERFGGLAGDGSLRRMGRHLGALAREAGPVFVAGLAGAFLLALRVPMVLLSGAGVALTTLTMVQMRTDLPLVYDLPVFLLVSALAGLASGWLADRRSWGPAVAVALAGWMGVGSVPSADAGRSYLTPDASRLLSAELPRGALVVAHDDGWLFPLWHLLAVDRARMDLTVATGLFESPAGLGPAGWREPLEREAERFGGGVAILWALARGRSPGVFTDPVEVPLPSRGWNRRGHFARITGPGRAIGAERAPSAGLRSGSRDGGRDLALAGRLGLAGMSGSHGRRAWPHPADAVSDGMRFLDEMRPLEAGQAFEAALGMDQRSVPGWNGLGLLAFMEERFGDSLKAYRHARAIAPLDDHARAGEAKAREALEASGRVPKLEKRAARTPGDPAVLCDLGSAYFKMGRERSAERLFRRAISADAGFARAWDNLGSMLALHGERRKALRAYRRAVEADPEYAPAMVNAGAVCMWMGDRREAREWLERARKAGSREPRLEEMLKIAIGH